MARKNGRDITGWLIVDKPAGIGSTEVVTRARRALDARKAGHAGTLDPAATGVLAVALGEATKTVPFVTDDDKCYRFILRWGQATDTDDAEGRITAESPVRPDEADIRAALPSFVGDIMQVPPRYSAVKLGGERAYTLARDGEEFQLEPRPLHVESFDLRALPDRDHAEFDLVCGKGGYVRAIARDLGVALGTLAHVTTLRRLWAGPFTLEDALDLAQIEALAREGTLIERLLPLEAGLSGLAQVRCTPEGAARLRQGSPGRVLSSEAGYGEPAWGSFQGRPVAVGIYRDGTLHPTRVFNL